MNDLNFNPEKLRAEAAMWQQQSKELLQQLGAMHDIDVGTAPKEAVYAEDKLKLYRYRSNRASDVSSPLAGEGPGVRGDAQRNSAPNTIGPAVLIVYALVNRPYMLDLQPDRSMIRGLLEQGLDVFLIDWGCPDGADRYLEFTDYVNRYILNCVNKVCELRNESQVNLLGVCQGGTLSTCFTALHPELVKNLITMVAPIDFQTENDLLSRWLKNIDIDALVAASGNISGEFLNAAFVNMMPFRLQSQKYVSLLDIAHDHHKLENFMRMEKWIFDSPAQAGAMFRQFVQWLYQQNRLIKNELLLGGKRVALKNITQPVLNVYATQDHLVPPAASTCLQKYAGSKDYTEFAFEGGHIGIYVSGKAKQVPIEIAQWLKDRT
ncbi:MAG TPA: class III poly(R)-hydroxyalkanoic acid synthase subunit PhaC [Steroidobacteraceae bacterium]|nr:class III poly(R)-hydroxyalkanoic acid synthase subunit PhaC [Steroidobacteraceae bacterium]